MTSATEALRGFFRARAGISLAADKDYLVASRLEPRLRGWAVPDLASLVARLRAQPTGLLADQVIAALTTNETLWFRDTKPFEAMRHVILPDLVARCSGERLLRIWSAGCSTGQEVYSLAIVLNEAAEVLRGWKRFVLGTDISVTALDRARSGSYTQFEVQRGLPPQHLSRYFEADGAGWRIRPELRTGIEFRQLNLLDVPRDIGTFDVIFCRNVLIYFDMDVKRQVLASVASRLRPGGYLALGGAETMLGLSTCFTNVPGATGMYRKCDTRF
jgi:chemotaxis protein methyltransferase CheR